jgi:nucleotide-binding universal stress UspA family protein
VVGLCPLIQPVLRAYVSDEVLRQQSEAARDLAQSLKDQFETAVCRLGLAGEYRAEGCLEPDVARLLSAHARSADVLVMGAYGHTRFRERVLGGATQHIFKHMTVPTLLSH